MNYWILSLVLILVVLLTTSYTETWVDYKLKPYDYIYSGRDPLYYYRYDRYRKPYRDGYRFYQSYPIPHLRYYN